MAQPKERAAAYPIVEIQDDGEAMEREAMGKAARALGDGPLTVDNVHKCSADHVMYRIVREERESA